MNNYTFDINKNFEKPIQSIFSKKSVSKSFHGQAYI